MVYASCFIVLHSKGSSLQNRIRTFSHALLFDNVQKWVKKWVKGKLGIKKKSLSYCNLGTFVVCVKRRERFVNQTLLIRCNLISYNFDKSAV